MMSPRPIAWLLAIGLAAGTPAWARAKGDPFAGVGGRIGRSLKADVAQQITVGRAMTAIRSARARGRSLSKRERALVRRAEKLVSQGTPLPPAFKTIGHSGRRAHQTMLSVANEGTGHIKVTLKDKKLLRGVVVHHEHINRETMEVAPYRMIDTRLNARVRLHSAGEVPVSVYFGRPNYQPDYKTDKVTPIATTAASATSVFKNGVADVKVAMDGLTASQAVELMRGVARAAIRRPGQYFSAAFNLGTPLVDDRPSTLRRKGHPVTLTDPYDIARLGVRLTHQGGWNKVAWDAASGDYHHSVMFFGLLGGLPKGADRPIAPTEPRYRTSHKNGVRRLTRLVHLAHSLGLETYISARSNGLREEHLAGAVQAGVDGIGVGFSMHEPGSRPLMAGPLDPRRISAKLKMRNRLQASPLGRGAKALARLDSEAARKTITAERALLRKSLYGAMLSSNEAQVTQLIGQMSKTSGRSR